MKLLTKLTLFITFSKLLIVVLFVLLLPTLVEYVSMQYSTYYLTQQKKKVLEVIRRNSIGYYLDSDSAYGSYTMLREEYISIIPTDSIGIRDTIETAQRIIEADTLDYRVLIHHLRVGERGYVLEIGKTTATIGEYNLLLQRFTLYVLIGLILISIIVDLLYTNILLRPLANIVRTKLLNHKFPFKDPLVPVETSTSDFKYLDDSLISLMEKIHEAFYKEREFTSNASHELMTPISVLQTNLENLMLDEEVPAQLQDRLSGMMKTVNRLKKIVHSLLYISRIENEQYAKTDTVSLRKVIDEVMDELGPRLGIASLQFTNTVNRGLTLKGVNHDLFFQMIYNLINNAIRYNREGGSIVVSANNDIDGYSVSISDTGIGIEESELSNIFNRFKKSGTRSSEGYGLGLSIVKSIIVFHGFDIRIASTIGKGTVVTVRIPAEQVG